MDAPKMLKIHRSGRLFYETRVVLHLVHGPHAAPALRLQSVKPPHRLEG
jgi:hypothetical protein